MFNALASVVMAVAGLWHGFFGGSQTKLQTQPPVGNQGNSTVNMGIASSSRWQNGSSTRNRLRRALGNFIGQGQGVAGRVSAIDGSMITVVGREGFGSGPATTSFSVDASSAKFIETKRNQNEMGETGATSTAFISDVKIGDNIFVGGTKTGTSVVAKTILIGVIPQAGRPQRPPMGDGQQ
jgi:hypothetical protein